MPEVTPPTSGMIAPRGASFRRFAAGVLLLNLFVAGLAGFSLYHSHRQYEVRAAIQTQNLAQSLSLTIAGIVDKTGIALLSVQRERERQLGKGTASGPYLDDYILAQRLLIPELDGLRVTDARGAFIHGDKILSGPDTRVKDRSYFIKAQSDPRAGLIISEPLFGRSSHKWVVNIARRIDNPDGSFAGVVVGAISLDYLMRLFATFDVGRHGVLNLRDGALHVVIRYPEPRSIGSTAVSKELRALVRSGQTVGTYRTRGSVDPVERTISFRKVTDYPLYVAAGLAAADYLAPWRREARVMAFLVAVFVAGSCLAARLIQRNRAREAAARGELLRHRELLEATVHERTAQLEAGNALLAQEIVLRKQVEAELKKAAIIMDRMADAVAWVAPDGRFLYVNDAACRMYGLSRDEMLSLTVPEISLTLNNPEAWQHLMDYLRREGYRHFEAEAATRDGRRFPVEITANYLNIDGREYNCTILRDISERREAEAEKQALTLQLSHSQKIESIGRLAGGIAHDFNNLLTPILGYAELLKNRFPADSRDAARVERIAQAAGKAKILTQQLLSFGRKQILEMKTIDLNNVVASFYEILRRTIRENIAIRLHLAETASGIRADRNQLEQIIMNLAVNAQDAIADRGVITIETAPVILDDEYVRQHEGLAPGPYLLLAFSDSGAGMDRDTLAHVFEPFFTTKDVGKGSGLGLATVYGLVRQHGGHVAVFSEEGEGTTFKIYFPAVAGELSREAAVAEEFAEVDVAGCTILLVEDNDMVRNLVSDLLESRGCRLIVAEGPRQALELSAGRELDLLLTDVVMPDMNGPELSAKLRPGHPGLRTLYMSGYTDNAIVHHGVLDEGVNFIPKPFTARDLMRKIDTILNGPVGEGPAA
ncbi:response regulator [Geobacter sp. FeAm09]|uniref:hybrid sensor histidine kinase/response regulator n=1 Tax=Geobacter sp. FeAm09 TaxID=2597769 RepID=UPI0011EFFBAB|nr:hybrid sensor histidine kinase/response regulator [Geobacter sp. FeAm09]QEM67540.1 response regulator [Geobacter sp. FeAm09]